MSTLFEGNYEWIYAVATILVAASLKKVANKQKDGLSCRDFMDFGFDLYIAGMILLAIQVGNEEPKVNMTNTDPVIVAAGNASTDISSKEEARPSFPPVDIHNTPENRKAGTALLIVLFFVATSMALLVNRFGWKKTETQQRSWAQLCL